MINHNWLEEKYNLENISQYNYEHQFLCGVFLVGNWSIHVNKRQVGWGWWVGRTIREQFIRKLRTVHHKTEWVGIRLINVVKAEMSSHKVKNWSMDESNWNYVCLHELPFRISVIDVIITCIRYTCVVQT